MKRLLFVACLTANVAAAPLFTPEYPLWVSDAVRSLREKGVISAGTLTQQAITRQEMSTVLDRYLQMQAREQEGVATHEEVSELRRLFEALLQGSQELEQRTEELEKATEQLDR